MAHVKVNGCTADARPAGQLAQHACPHFAGQRRRSYFEIGDPALCSKTRGSFHGALPVRFNDVDQPLWCKRSHQRMGVAADWQAVCYLSQCFKVKLVSFKFTALRQPGVCMGMRQHDVAARPAQSVGHVEAQAFRAEIKPVSALPAAHTAHH